MLDILTAKALAACTMGATPGDKKHILRETETLYNAIQLVSRVQVTISGSANMGLDMISYEDNLPRISDFWVLH